MNNDPRSTAQQKRARNKTKPVIFTKQNNSLGSNISSIIEEHLPIITDNSSLDEMFAKESTFFLYKRFPSLKDLMV